MTRRKKLAPNTSGSLLLPRGTALHREARYTWLVIRLPVVVYVIEGLLKADISHCLTGRTFAAIAGANNTSPLDPLFALLAQSGTEEIIEAHDMDKYNNQMTMAGASKIYLTARKYGMNCRRLTWNPNYKGFDDWQLALRRENQRRKEIDRLSFKAQYLRGLCELAHIEDCTEQWQHRRRVTSV